ncbi:hypothetical protein VKT23_009152 [Stygiomarasmius scandens]|uniref:Protein kinase domain-containing protein n=1 Tax=Marasmiellus scandens TaxID=2682957 RepID=A0ABR1JHB2_9AGAR
MSSGYSQTIKNLNGCTIMDGHFVLKKLLGAGAFGTVYLAERVSRGKGGDKERFAVKVMPKHAPTSLEKKQLNDELLLQMAASGHRNVLKAREVSHATLKGEEFVCIRMDLCKQDMLDAIYEGAFDSEERARSAFLQIVDGVMHSHENGVYHRDLKFENILCSGKGKDFSLQIADFGLATKESIITNGWYAGTSKFMPPECISSAYRRPQGYSPAQQDTWAIGFMLAMVCGNNMNPWDIACPNRDARFDYYTEDTSRLRGMLPDASDELIEMLRFKVLTVDPSERASLQELRSFIETAPLFKKEKGFFSKLFNS